jgi:hypothetical protein
MDKKPWLPPRQPAQRLGEASNTSEACIAICIAICKEIAVIFAFRNKIAQSAPLAVTFRRPEGKSRTFFFAFR